MAITYPANDLLFEVVDGRIVEVEPMGAFESVLASYLLPHLASSSRRLGRAVMETLFCLNPTTRLERRPDLAFVSYERWPRDQKVPRKVSWEVVPDLAVEVVSPTNSADEVLVKVREYFSAGCLRVWVIYSAEEQVYVYRSPTEVRILTKNDTLDGESVLPDFKLPLVNLFDEVTYS